MKTASRIVLLGFWLFGFGCHTSGIPIITLSPVGHSYKWQYGEPVVTTSAAGVELTTTFKEQSGNDLVFLIQVANNSDDTLVVAPEVFHCLFYDEKPQDSLSRIRQTGVARAHDPEIKVAGLGNRINAENESYAASQGVDVAVSLLLLATDLASVNEPTTEAEQERRDRMRSEMNYDRRVREIHHRDRIQGLEDSRAMWQSVTLRKTTLFPGESAGGIVLFPITAKGNHVALSIPIGAVFHEVMFEVKRL